MTTKHTAGDLTTLWVENDDEPAEFVAVAASEAADNAPVSDIATAETLANEDTETESGDEAEIVAPIRSAKTERRRLERQYAQSQRRAREATLQVLFEVDLVGHDVADVRERQFDQMLLNEDARSFAIRLIDGVLHERTRLDALIADLAPTWPTDQLPRVDINVLRLALYELLAEPETPTGAIINEAVELGKQYGSENSGKFVNGVLGTVATRITSGTMQRNLGTIQPN